MTREVDRQIDQSFDGREVGLRAGQRLELSLPENPTTGFTWEIQEAGAPACALRGTVFDPPTAVICHRDCLDPDKRLLVPAARQRAMSAQPSRAGEQPLA